MSSAIRRAHNRIKKTACLLKETCRKEDIIARWGGDEFAIMLLRTGWAEALAILSNIREACAAQRDSDIPTSVSIALRQRTGMEESLTEVLGASEKAMYETKLVEARRPGAILCEHRGARMAQKGYAAK
jgi:diguanylate cyclase (GGDEF)-like protein